MAGSKIRSLKSTLCLSMWGTAKSHGKGHGYKEWCHLSCFALNKVIFSKQSFERVQSQVEVTSKVFKPSGFQALQLIYNQGTSVIEVGQQERKERNSSTELELPFGDYVL